MSEFKRYDHQGNLVPNVEYSESDRPHAEFLPAPWLPLGELDKYFEEYLSVLPGKILALTRDEKVVPAGYLNLFKAANANDVVLKYEQVDLDESVISLQSGLPVSQTDLTANGSTGWTKSDLETALRARGLLGASEDLSEFISAPIGVAPYSYFNAMSPTDPNDPTTLRRKNFNLQHRVAVLCDYVLELPWVPAVQALQTMSQIGTIKDYTATQANIFYLEIVGLAGPPAVPMTPIAPDTQQTRWSFSNDPLGLFKVKKNSLRQVKALGDFFIDDALNRLYFYHAGPLLQAQTDAGSVQVLFYHYASASDAAISTKFACVVGPVKPGDYLKPTAKSNFVPVSKADAHISYTALSGGAYSEANVNALFSDLFLAIEEEAQIIGQVIGVKDYTKTLLGSVRSYGQSLPDSMYRDRMPGSATEGRPDKITYAGGANKTILVNIIKK